MDMQKDFNVKDRDIEFFMTCFIIPNIMTNTRGRLNVWIG